MRNPKIRPTYYSFSALRDGCLLAGHETRKPLPSQLRGRTIDEDGVWQVFERTEPSFHNAEEPHHIIVPQVLMAGRINARRSIRELLFPRLDRLDERLSAIEAKLDQILAAQRG